MVAKRSPELYSRHSQVDVHSSEKASRYWDAFCAWQEACGHEAELKQDLMTSSFPWHRLFMGRKYGTQLLEVRVMSLRLVIRDSTPVMDVKTSRVPQARFPSDWHRTQQHVLRRQAVRYSTVGGATTAYSDTCTRLRQDGATPPQYYKHAWVILVSPRILLFTQLTVP